MFLKVSEVQKATKALKAMKEIEESPEKLVHKDHLVKRARKELQAMQDVTVQKALREKRVTMDMKECLVKYCNVLYFVFVYLNLFFIAS